MEKILAVSLGIIALFVFLLVGAYFILPETLFHLAGNSMGGMLAGMYGARYPKKVLTLAFLAPGGIGSPDPSEVAILLRKGTNPLLTGSAEDYDKLLKPYVPQIQAPVLIIWGESDKILNVGGVSIMEKNLKNYKTVIMKNTGHTPMLEKPRETAAYYLSYLKGY